MSVKIKIKKISDSSKFFHHDVNIFFVRLNGLKFENTGKDPLRFFRKKKVPT